MSWVSALKEWNSGKGTWCIPKKGTTEHGEVLAIIERTRGSTPAPSQQPRRSNRVMVRTASATTTAQPARPAPAQPTPPTTTPRAEPRQRPSKATINMSQSEQSRDMYNSTQKLEKDWRKSSEYASLYRARKTSQFELSPEGLKPILEKLKNDPDPLWRAARVSKVGKAIIALDRKYPGVYGIDLKSSYQLERERQARENMTPAEIAPILKELDNIQKAWRKSTVYANLLRAGETEADDKRGPDVYPDVIKNLDMPADRQTPLWRAARESIIGKRLIAFDIKYPWIWSGETRVV